MESILKVRGLSKYFGRRKVVDNIDLDVYAGEVLGFLGPNGAGKTTAIKTILGFLSNDGGSVSVCGYDLKKDYEKAMACVGGIVENPDMYKQFSGRLNLEMYARTHGNITGEQIDRVVSLVKLENRINDKVKKYSLGMKQRLGLAQAILHRPKLLLLDEPTNGLDPAGIKELRDILKRLAHEENAAVLVSSHQLAEMQLMCDRVVIISEGKILCEKTIEELSRGDSVLPTYKIFVNEPEKASEILADNEALAGDGCVELKLNRDELPSVVESLVTGGVLVYEINREESSLEDAFIKITGGGAQIA